VVQNQNFLEEHMLSKKAKERISGAITSLIIIILIVVGGSLTNPSPKEEVRTAIFTMAGNGQSIESISSSYKFREYPYKRIFEELKNSGELYDIAKRGWSR
jgi:hypothetical protein